MNTDGRERTRMKGKQVTRSAVCQNLVDAPYNTRMGIDETLTKIEQIGEEQLSFVEQYMGAANGNLYAVDFLVCAVIQRSMDLIDAFVALVRSQNLRVAAALIRMQIDSAMRLNALNLVADSNELVLHLMGDEPLHKLKGLSKVNLSDAYLHRQLSSRYPWVSKVYGATSGFIHLSKSHLLSLGTPSDTEPRVLDLRIGRGTVWPTERQQELVDAFLAATVGLTELCNILLEEKRSRS
jgi:hypothetical protein